MEPSSRHISRHRGESAAGTSGEPPRNMHRSELQKVLDSEPKGNYKVVGDKRRSGYRINGVCSKLPHLNVTELPTDPRKFTLQPNDTRRIITYKEPEPVQYAVASFASIHPHVTQETLYDVCTKIFNKSAKEMGIYAYTSDVHIAYIEFPRKQDLLHFMNKVIPYADSLYNPNEKLTSDDLCLKINCKYYKKTGRFLPPSSRLLKVDQLYERHRKLDPHGEFALPSQYYMYINDEKKKYLERKERGSSKRQDSSIISNDSQKAPQKSIIQTKSKDISGTSNGDHEKLLKPIKVEKEEVDARNGPSTSFASYVKTEPEEPKPEIKQNGVKKEQRKVSDDLEDLYESITSDSDDSSSNSTSEKKEISKHRSPPRKISQNQRNTSFSQYNDDRKSNNRHYNSRKKQESNNNPTYQMDVGERLRRIIENGRSSPPPPPLIPPPSSSPKKPAPKVQSPAKFPSIEPKWQASNNGRYFENQYNSYYQYPAPPRPVDFDLPLPPPPPPVIPPEGIIFAEMLKKAKIALSERVRKNVAIKFQADLSTTGRKAALDFVQGQLQLEKAKEKIAMIKSPPPSSLVPPKVTSSTAARPVTKLSEIGPIPKVPKSTAASKLVKSVQKTSRQKSQSPYQSPEAPIHISSSSEDESSEDETSQKSRTASEIRQPETPQVNGFHSKSLRDVSPIVPRKLSAPKPPTPKVIESDDEEREISIEKSSTKSASSSSKSSAVSSRVSSRSEAKPSPPKRVIVSESSTEESDTSSDEDSAQLRLRDKTTSHSFPNSPTPPPPKIEKIVSKKRSHVPSSSAHDSDSSDEYTPSDDSEGVSRAKVFSKTMKKSSKLVLNEIPEKRPPPPPKKARLEKTDFDKIMPRKPQKNFVDESKLLRVDDFDYGPVDLPPFTKPKGDMLTEEFWSELMEHQIEAPRTRTPRDFFIIPVPLRKNRAKVRYNMRNPYEEYRSNMRFVDEGLDEEELMYTEMAYDRVVAENLLPFSYALEWNDPAVEPEPELHQEPFEHDGIVHHYVDPDLHLIEPVKEGCAKTRGLMKYSRTQKVARRRLTVPPRLILTEEDRQMVRNTHEQYRTENTLLRQLKTAGLDGLSLLTSNALASRPTCVTFAPSRIHDWGLFTLEDIKPKAMIIEYIGEICRSTVVEEREQRYLRRGIGSSYLFRIDKDFVIDATRMGNSARFINHSCTPNSYARVVKGNHIAIYSKRYIEAGEEITYDYKFPVEDNKIPCFCNAPNCRGSLN